MNKTPLVSLLMTVFNREKYIGEAIESVLNSTYKNWELIIVDDQSTDKSVKIAYSYAAQNARINVYKNEKNLGDYPNRNKAAINATGKYLKYIDADDLLYPYGLEEMVFYMEKFPSAAYGLSKIPKDNERIFPFELYPREAYLKHYSGIPIFNKAPLSAIINRKFFNKVGGFTNQRYVGDFDLWHKLSCKYPVVLMPDGMVWYRKHDSQEINNYKRNPEIMFSYFLISKKYLLDQNCPLNNVEKQKIIKKIDKTIARYIFHYIRKGMFKIANNLMSKSSVNINFIIKHLN